MAEDIVEQIKARLRIEDVVQGDGYPLPTRGIYRKCTTKGTGGLIVNVAKQLYYWNSRSEWGDVVSWVQARKGTDFKGAIEELARLAGLPEPNWRGEDMVQRAAARAREEALDVAQRVFVRWFWRCPDAQAYAKGRGWTDDQAVEPTIEDPQPEPEPGTLRMAMLGYSGEGSDAERAEMRRELEGAGVDLSSPAAVAILGMRGNVHEWAKAHGIQLNDDWLANGYIPGMLGRKRLVYAHVRGGRVRYLSGRGIEQKFHYNLPESLVGKRQVYHNQVYTPAAPVVVVVEGQADAISLGQLGVAAVALAGVAPDEDVVEQLKHHQAVYVGLDADTAGDKNRWRVADAISPTVRLVRWDGLVEHNGVKDANDLLRSMLGMQLSEEAQAATVRGMLESAPTYVEMICAWAGYLKGAERDQAQIQALKVVARLDKMRLSQYRSQLAKALGVSVRELENMLKALQLEEKAEKAKGEPVYTWGGLLDGWLVEYLYDIEEDRASLAWRDPQGVIGSGDSVNIEGRCYMPYPPTETLRTGSILFPSGLGERKSLAELIVYIKMYMNWVYMLPSEETAGLVAYWVLSTWIYDCFETVIYLRAMGGAGSGKSEFLYRIGMISYRTLSSSGASSTSALFRSAERYKGVVAIDEADLEQSDTANDMVKFYNQGAMKGHPIWRTIEVTGPNGEKTFEEIGFQTFCPKMIGMRKDFKDDAVGTRSLTLKLQPREMTELRAAGVPLTVNQEIRARAQALRNLLCRWRLETWQVEIPVDFDLYDMEISARLNQVAGPLLAIARDDPAQQDEIRHTLRDYYRETILSQNMTIAARVLEALWKIYQYQDLRDKMVKRELDGREAIKVGDVTRITNDIINEMNDADEEDDKKGGRELSAQRIGKVLRAELNMAISQRTREGYKVYWNGPRMEGLSVRFGINPADFRPIDKPSNPTPPPAPSQGGLYEH
jgi:hypothetical protein